MGMDLRGRRIFRAVAVAVAMSWTLVVSASSSSPAGAQAPPIVVEPSTGLTDGQDVTVTVNGPQLWIGQCAAEVSLLLDSIQENCGNSTYVQGEERPAQVTVTVWSTFRTSSGRTVDCGIDPGDCVIFGIDQMMNAAKVPITIEPPALAARLPEDPLADGARLDIIVSGTPGETVTVAQCADPVPADLASSRCGPHVDVLVDEDGRVDRWFTVSAVVDTGDGPLDCRPDVCALAAFDETGALVRALPMTMQAPVAITVRPVAAGLTDGARVTIEVTGYRKVSTDLWQCRVGATPDRLGNDCTSLHATVPSGSLRVQHTVQLATSFTTAMGGEVTCGAAPGDCVILTGNNTWSPWASTPVSFARATLAPSSTGLLDGQAITLTVTGLLPDTAHRAVRCGATTTSEPISRYCEPWSSAPVTVTDDQGNLVFEWTAAQRLGSDSTSPQYCRDGCTIELGPDIPGVPRVRVPYAMAEATLSASPASGLSDGDTVTVTASDLMASYAGPPFWFFPATGGWGVAQCANDVVDEPTIFGFFTHCAAAGPGAVDVPGSTAAVEIPAAAAFTSILGADVDCAATPESCVLALARVEQDGSVSIHTTPISFG